MRGASRTPRCLSQGGLWYRGTPQGDGELRARDPYLVRRHLADRVPGLQRLQLVQAPVQLLQGLPRELLMGIFCQGHPPAWQGICQWHGDPARGHMQGPGHGTPSPGGWLCRTEPRGSPAWLLTSPPERGGWGHRGMRGTGRGRGPGSSIPGQRVSALSHNPHRTAAPAHGVPCRSRGVTASPRAARLPWGPAHRLGFINGRFDVNGSLSTAAAARRAARREELPKTRHGSQRAKLQLCPAHRAQQDPSPGI